MSTERIYIDATEDPSLSRIAREVRDSGKPHVIRLGAEDVAVITPITRRRKASTITDADRQAFLESLA